ncbi:MAG: bifunctional 3,4-dihydroxy-2-butanone-4-phosphate synthase/GTP cyclohydrolase II [Bacteroidota bacterium]|nr:bifunctional 3,4-dihydroxy-2-butanone-4-phosphate synthase/GTP cyclohydrolase II [Bacteroidota bacterium]
MNKFNTIEEAIEDIKNGKMVVVIDDEARENEGDLIMAAEKVTPQAINFMVTHARGLICMPVIGERLHELNIGNMVDENTDVNKTAFTVSIDAVETTTGISAFDRSLTIQKVLDPNAQPSNFNRPGHIFPLEAIPGGVLIRPGHTEASVDLAQMAGLYPAGVICEIMNEDGSMARVPQLMEYVEKHNLKIITIADLIEFRKKHEVLVEKVSEAALPTKYGEFRIHGYVNKITGEEHVALVMGDVSTEPVLVRLHSECLTGDVFGSLRCDCGEQLDKAMETIGKEGKGVVLYMRQEGRGIGLLNKIKAYSLQDMGMDTVEANLALGFPDDMREYSLGSMILADIGAKKIKLMTNNPDKIEGIEAFGVHVTERIPIKMNHNEKNLFYLQTKQQKMGHMVDYLNETKPIETISDSKLIKDIAKRIEN